MTRDDFHTLWSMATGVWPRLDNDATAVAWWGLLCQYPANTAMAALRKYASERRQPPTPADLIEGIRLIARQSTERSSARAIEAAECVDCRGTGFAWVSFEGQGTVGRCRSGCLPPLPAQRKIDERSERADPSGWVARLQEIRTQQAEQRRTLGEKGYLTERGYDPAHYRIVEGTIVRRPTA